MQKNVLHKLCEAAVVAALYTVLTVLIPAISFGPFQLRLSEILTVLPVFTPAAIPGLTLGCFFSNLIGLTAGANLAGAWDLVFGTCATLCAALITYQLRNIRFLKLPILSILSPIVLNAIVVGAELTMALFDSSLTWFFVTAGQVAISEVISAGIGGALLFTTLTKTGADKTIFSGGSL